MTERSGQLYVLAGVNGSGKSSVGAARLSVHDDYYNPDLIAAELQREHPLWPLAQAQTTSPRPRSASATRPACDRSCASRRG